MGENSLGPSVMLVRVLGCYSKDDISEISWIRYIRVNAPWEGGN